MGLAVALVVISLSGTSVRRDWLRLVRRTRWLLLSLIVVLSWSIAGTPVWSSEAQPLLPAPTMEGLGEGLLQALRLLATLGIVALLLATTPVNALIGGMRTLMTPFVPLGIVDRFVIRLALTLEYGGATERATWRELLAEPAAADACEIRLTRLPPTIWDGLFWVAAALAGFLAIAV